ncbi:recombinase family protein [[Mycobacterium] nativiensis]|uniref:Recombinase family protein n=1 Tax=[Mycobacterium] nativiensis TaxID=2855503 RepID=A0ABU5XT15_9MYCO|nr:recombinase family protein [Mycolicibacter sp. MYC340]MEB3031078.1 recombinase family protein [Mycolicibacter sp. MYC340]
MTGKRVLGRVRLSRLTEESTSEDRQRELIEQWATMQGHVVVGWAEDIDVSGAVDVLDARKRTELGGWLRDRHPEFDIIACWKLDRLSRSTINMNKLFAWAVEHDKAIVSVTENIDLSTPVGRLIAQVISFLAEGELEAIRERTRSSRKKLVESGRWPGGPLPYGFESVKCDDGGWKLQPREDQAAVIRRIFTDICSGMSMEAVAKKLNADGVPSAKGKQWRSANLFVIMESKLLLGHSTYKDQTVWDSQGKPVLVSDEGVLTPEEFDRLQLAIQARRIPGVGKRTQNTSPLYGVIFCDECGKMMYHRKYKPKADAEQPASGYQYEYYFCPSSCGRMIHAQVIYQMLEDRFLEELGQDKVTERVLIPAESHEAELKEALAAVDELSSLVGTMTSEAMRHKLAEQLRALDVRISELEKLPVRESHFEYRETGQTNEQAWSNADLDSRRELLVKGGISATAFKPKDLDDVVVFRLHSPKGRFDKLVTGGGLTILEDDQTELTDEDEKGTHSVDTLGGA